MNLELYLDPHHMGLVSFPDVVRKVSIGHIMTKLMPEAVRKEMNPTELNSYYLLISERQAFTIGHQDFTGSWVAYTLHKGRKRFTFAAPTKANLSTLRRWRCRTIARFYG